MQPISGLFRPKAGLSRPKGLISHTYYDLDTADLEIFTLASLLASERTCNDKNLRMLTAFSFTQPQQTSQAFYDALTVVTWPLWQPPRSLRASEANEIIFATGKALSWPLGLVLA